MFEFSDVDNNEIKKNQKSVKSKGETNKQEEEEKEEEEEVIEKEEPCFEPSGILAEYSNKVKGVVLKFTEPLDAAEP